MIIEKVSYRRKSNLGNYEALDDLSVLARDWYLKKNECEGIITHEYRKRNRRRMAR